MRRTVAILGLVSGIATAPAAWADDAGLLAHPDHHTAPAPPAPRIEVSPSFAFRPDGRFSLGLAGRF